MNMIPLAFFAPGHGIIWLILVLLVIAIYKWKAILAFLSSVLLVFFIFPLAIISTLFKWEPKFLKKWEKNIEEYNKKEGPEQ